MAKKFFYVCAGLFLLALSYQLGVRSAGAQSTGAISAGNPYYCGNTNACMAAVVGRQLYLDGQPARGPIPGTDRVLWIGEGTYHNTAVMLENGDTYWDNGSAWVYVGNAAPGATGAVNSSWGSLKTK